MTASAPAASALRSTVPALPGSRTFASRATRAGRAAVTCSSGTSTKSQTASRPCGVTVWASSPITSPLTVSTSTPASCARAIRPACRASAGAVAKSSRTQAPVPSASATACGPSARKARSCWRSARLVSRRAALTRAKLALAYMNQCSLRCGADGLGQRQARHLDQGGEGRRVGHGEVGEHPTVDLDARRLETLDEAVVGQPVRPRRGVDALDPEPAEVALAVLAVAVGVGHRVEDLLLGLAVEPGPLAAVALRTLEDYPALLLGVQRTLDACHCSISLWAAVTGRLSWLVATCRAV